MSKFKIGDRVRVNYGGFAYLGNIISAGHHEGVWRIKFDEGREIYHENYLELVNPKNHVIIEDIK